MLVEMLHIGGQLRDLRKRRLLTQEQLAERSGVGVATITRVERNQVEPQGSTLRKLADALGVEVQALFPSSQAATERVARPAAVTLAQWLEERVGHAHLAGSLDELRHFLEDAETLDEQLFRRGLLREEIDAAWAERKKFPATEPQSIAGTPFGVLHNRYIRTLFVAVEMRIVTHEAAAEEVRELAFA